MTTVTRATIMGGTVMLACATLAACGGNTPAQGSGVTTPSRPHTHDTRSAGGYRIIGTPIAAVATTANGITTANVTVRTDPALPFRDGRVSANIRLDGASGASPAIRVGGRTHHCYIQSVDEYPHPARTGDDARLTLKIPGVKRQLQMTLKFAGAKDSHRRYKTLCGRRMIFDDPDRAP